MITRRIRIPYIENKYFLRVVLSCSICKQLFRHPTSEILRLDCHFTQLDAKKRKLLFRTMTLLLRNLQKTVVFDLPKLKTDINLLRRIFRTERYDLGVICMEDGQLREMNKMYRGRNEPTDVLSFPSHEVGYILKILILVTTICLFNFKIYELSYS